MIYSEGDWVKLSWRKTGEVFAAGQIISTKKQGLISFDNTLFFIEDGNPRYNVEANPEHIVKELTGIDMLNVAMYVDLFNGIDVYIDYPITELDSEVVSLVKSLNLIPGITTKGSCCGHGKEELWVSFIVENISCVKKLSCFLDKNVWYEISLDRSDPQARLFIIKTKEFGEKAYKAADNLAKKLTMIFGD